MPLPLLPLSVGAGIGGGFQPREMGRPMPLPSGTGGAAAPLALARCSAAARISVNVLRCWGAGPPPSELLLPLRATGAAAPGDSRPAMMLGDSGAGATAGQQGATVEYNQLHSDPSSLAAEAACPSSGPLLALRLQDCCHTCFINAPASKMEAARLGLWKLLGLACCPSAAPCCSCCCGCAAASSAGEGARTGDSARAAASA